VASGDKTGARYVVIHELDESAASRANAELRARAEAKGMKLPSAAQSARSLREWRTLLAEKDGKLVDPTTKRRRTIPLESFEDAHPDRTWLQIGFAGGLLPYTSYTVHGEAMIVHGQAAAARLED
jgi:hypothetical protein